MAEQLRTDLSAEDLGKETGHRIANLPVNGLVVPENSNIVGKRLQPAEFTHAQTAIAPVERACRRTGLRLDCPGRAILLQLEKETPVAPPPAEQR